MLDGLMSDYPFLKMLDEEALAIIERNLVQKKVQAGELLINGEEACWGFSFDELSIQMRQFLIK